MTGGPSALSLAAAGLYLILIVATGLALASAIGQRQITWHKIAWAAISAIFFGLVLIRVFTVEELVRTDLREVLLKEGVYEDRRAVQGPLFVLVLAMALAVAAGLLYFVARGVRGRRDIAAIVAIGCTGGMVFLLALRLLSLHSVDELLYGPLKLNWVADLGLSLTVLGSAIRYVSVVRSGSSGKAASPRRSQR